MKLRNILLTAITFTTIGCNTYSTDSLFKQGIRESRREQKQIDKDYEIFLDKNPGFLEKPLESRTLDLYRDLARQD